MSKHTRNSSTRSNRQSGTGTTRRTLLSGVGTAALAATVGGLGSTTASGGTREGTQGETNSATDSDLEWRFEVTHDFVESSPTVRDGVVYVADGEFGEAGQVSGTTYAVDVETEEVIWSETVPEQIRYAPHVVFGEVYVGGTEGGVYAYDAEDGDELWDVQTGEPVSSSPTRFEDLVYVPSDAGVLVAFDAETGEDEWIYSLAENITPSPTAPTVVDGTVYVADNPGQQNVEGWVHAIDAETGEEEWTFTGADLWFNSSPTVVDGVVYVGCDDSTLYALDADDGSVEWQFSDPEEQIISSTTYHDGVVYVGTDQETPPGATVPAALYAVDADTGNKIWDFTVDPPEDGGDWRFHSSPTVAGETVFIGSHNGTVYGVDVDSGNEVWSYETDLSVWSSPTVVDGTLYVGSDDGHLYALSVPEDGSSACSRVNLGTLGHHHVWTGTDDTEPGTVFGTVTDQGDDPVSGATVSLLDNGTELASTETDGDGEYSISEMPGTYELAVEASGFEGFSDDVTLVDGADTERNIQLTPLEGTVFGTVTDEEDDPVSGATVSLVDDGTELESTETDDGGEYSLSELPGTYELVVEATGFEEFSDEVTIESEEDTERNIQLTPLDPGQVSGTVTDPAETARAGVDVQFFLDGDEVDSVSTDGDGEYTSGELTPATYRVVVVIEEGDGYLTFNEGVTVEEDEQKTKNITVTEGPPPLPEREKPPTQASGLDEDGLYEDVTGDGEFDIADVQAFFTHLDSDEVQQHAEFYDFALLDDSEVTIFDVQGLYNRLSAAE